MKLSFLCITCMVHLIVTTSMVHLICYIFQILTIIFCVPVLPSSNLKRKTMSMKPWMIFRDQNFAAVVSFLTTLDPRARAPKVGTVVVIAVVTAAVPSQAKLRLLSWRTWAGTPQAKACKMPLTVPHRHVSSWGTESQLGMLDLPVTQSWDLLSKILHCKERTNFCSIELYSSVINIRKKSVFFWW